MEEIKDTKKTDLLLVDPRNIIVEEGFNVRKDYGDIEGLMQSIIENGLLEPLSASKVRGEDKFILTDGHRRMTAILKAIEKGHDIPFVKVITASGNIEDRLFNMVITGAGKKALTVLEEGEAYKRLVAYSYVPKDIAKKVGKSIATIHNLLTLADAPKVVKNAIERDEISGSTVVQIIREVKNPDELVRVIEEAVVEAKKGGTHKKATTKHLDKLKSPLQKLKETLVLLDGVAKDSPIKNLELLESLVIALEDKKSTAKSISKLFE